MRKKSELCNASHSHLYDYSTINPICCFHSKEFNTTVFVPVEMIETHTISVCINNVFYPLFEQAKLRFCQFTLKDRVLHSLAIIKTCFCDFAQASLTRPVC